MRTPGPEWITYIRAHPELLLGLGICGLVVLAGGDRLTRLAHAAPLSPQLRLCILFGTVALLGVAITSYVQNASDARSARRNREEWERSHRDDI